MSNPTPPAAQGRLIAVVGPSGAGKDSVMAGICAARPDLHRVQRVITRPRDAGGEDFTPVTDTQFEALANQGTFALHWRAHGLRYGIPATTLHVTANGQDALANLSRAALAEAAQLFENLLVLHITAPPEVLAQRVTARGREGAEAVQNRLSRPAPALPKGLQIIEVVNDGTLQAAVTKALAALYPESA